MGFCLIQRKPSWVSTLLNRPLLFLSLQRWRCKRLAHIARLPVPLPPPRWPRPPRSTTQPQSTTKEGAWPDTSDRRGGTSGNISRRKKRGGCCSPRVRTRQRWNDNNNNSNNRCSMATTTLRPLNNWRGWLKRRLVPAQAAQATPQGAPICTWTKRMEDKEGRGKRQFAKKWDDRERLNFVILYMVYSVLRWFAVVLMI